MKKNDEFKERLVGESEKRKPMKLLLLIAALGFLIASHITPLHAELKTINGKGGAKVEAKRGDDGPLPPTQIDNLQNRTKP